MKRNILISCIFLCFSNHAVSDGDLKLAPMTIYGDKLRAELVEPTRMQTELDREKLQAAEMPDLNNTLKSQSGLTITQGSGQMITNITMRGAGGAGQGLVTLDGIPLFGDFSGFFSLSHYPLDAIEKVTVTRGSGGDRHGSRTLGGAIHLQTRRLKEGDNFLHLEGGSYDTLREAVGSGLETQVGDFSAVIGRSDIFSGISQAQTGTERDNFGMGHASGNWFKKLNQGNLNASLYFVRSDEDTDGPGILPNRKLGWVDDKNGRWSDETWVAQLRGDYNLADNWNSSLQFGFTQNRQETRTTLVKPFAISSQLYMLDWKNTHRVPLNGNDKTQQALITWGVNTQHQQAIGHSFAEQTVISPNVRGELAIGDWEWSAEGRFDHGDAYGNHQVFSLGANRIVLGNLNIWANGGTGYRQPGVSELLNPLYGNKTLQGESNAGGEMGITWQPSSSSEIKVSGYYQNYQNMIVLQLDSTTGVVRSANVAKVDAWGAEMQAQQRWSKIWETGMSYGYIDAVNPLTHLKVPARPEHQGVFWNEIQLLAPLKLRIDLNVHDGYYFDTANTLKAKVAPRINAILKYQVTPKTQLYIRGENLSNERTAEITPDFNFNGTSFYLGFRTGF